MFFLCVITCAIDKKLTSLLTAGMERSNSHDEGFGIVAQRC